MTLKEKFEKFEVETSLMLSVLWDTENYSDQDVYKVNRSLVRDYFRMPVVKENLTVVDGRCLNSKGCDVREVAKNYIQHFKLVHNVKPIKS